MSTSTVTSQEFRSALSLLAGAVTLITTDGEGGHAGFTASAVCSVSDDPPTVLVCMRTASNSNPTFRKNGVLCINVLTPQQHALSGTFASAKLSQDERFAQAKWDKLVTGAPVLHDALINLDCKIVETHVVGTHDVCICRVLSVRIQPVAEGLAYFDRCYHHLSQVSRLSA